MSNRPMFPHTVDSTMLGTMRSCQHKMFRQYMQHWKPQRESVHLVAGGAFARGIEVARQSFFEGNRPVYEEVTEEIDGIPTTYMKNVGTVPCEKGDKELSEGAGLQALLIHYGDFECPPESAKSIQRTAGALEFYFEQYPLGGDGMVPITLPSGRRGIEFSFAEPLPIPHPITGDPILYTGRADMIAEYAGGIYVVDEKTTSSLGASWARQWEMRSQFTGYSWACQQAGIKPSGTIIRGVSILKTKYDHLQAITYRAQFEIDRWLDQTCRDVERLIKSWKEGHYDFALDHACAEYGGCSFVQICKSPSPDEWLPVYYEQRVWDPLLRKEMTVEEYEASWNHVSSES